MKAMMARSSSRLPISLVIPAYCAERTIERAIASAARQEFVPSEIIVVDDASGDRTADVAAAAGAAVIRLPRNGGPSAARNAGVAAAGWSWVAFLDADDVWNDGKLIAQWQALSRWPDAGFCFTDYDAVYADGHVVRRELCTDPEYAQLAPQARSGAAARFGAANLVPGLVRSMFVRQSSAIVDRRLFLRCGGYDAALRLAEDYDLFLRLIGQAPAIAIERPLVTYMRQPASLSADPLAEIRATDRLWTSVLAHPERYPQCAVDLIRQRRHVVLERGAGIALRLGRFGDAASLAYDALRFRPSPRAAALLATARALDNRPGAAIHAVARNVWRNRAGASTLAGV